MPADKKPVDEPRPFQRRVSLPKKKNPDAKDEAGYDGDQEMFDASVVSRTADLTLEEEGLPEEEALFLADLRQNLLLFDKAVLNFEPRFSVRALRATPRIRQRLDAHKLARGINAYFPKDDQTKFLYLNFLVRGVLFLLPDAPSWTPCCIFDQLRDHP
ncbi:MAG: hypothetical protein BJ554DRAFT_111, partial [Olpidium bornovanus]